MGDRATIARRVSVGLLLATVTAAQSAAPEAAAPMATAPNASAAVLFRLSSPDGTEYGFGTGLAALGDLDGDGHADFGVGNSYPVEGSNGQVQIHSGRDASLLRTIPAPESATNFGGTLAPIADLDGDGHGELAVSAVSVMTPCTLFVVSPVDGTVLHSWSTGEGADFFGHTVADVGDVDGDGVHDLATGAHAGRSRSVFLFLETRPQAFARVYSGRTGEELWTVEGEDDWFRFGDAVAPAGDVDGDGVPDVAVGETPGAYISERPTPSGNVHILSGRDGELIRRIDSPHERDPFACALALLGDLDGDGGPELAIGSDQYPADPDKALEGYVRVVSLRDGRTRFVTPGRARHDNFGQSLAVLGDWDGDGVADLAAGAPHTSSSSDPARPGYVMILSGRDGRPLATLSGERGEGSFGTSVAAAGDVDGDGRGDLLVGAPHGLGEGRVYVLSGAILVPASAEGTVPAR